MFRATAARPQASAAFDVEQGVAAVLRAAIKNHESAVTSASRPARNGKYLF